jgi:hypothetical protein
VNATVPLSGTGETVAVYVTGVSREGEVLDAVSVVVVGVVATISLLGLTLFGSWCPSSPNIRR